MGKVAKVNGFFDKAAFVGIVVIASQTTDKKGPMLWVRCLMRYYPFKCRLLKN
jgi:hypothetical protein